MKLSFCLWIKCIHQAHPGRRLRGNQLWFLLSSIMADLGVLKASASVLLTLSLFLLCPEETLSKVRIFPININTKEWHHYVGVDGDAPNGALRLIRDTVRTPQFVMGDNFIVWERNPDYCLTVDCRGKRIILRKCQGKPGPGKWYFNKEHHFYNTHCQNLVLVRQSGRVFMSSDLKGDNALWYFSMHFIIALQGYPPARYPLSAQGAEIGRELLRSKVNTFHPIGLHLVYPRDVGTFPGTVSDGTRRVSQTVELKREYQFVGKASSKTQMANPKAWQPTHLYAPPGQIMEVNLPERFSLNEARVVILRVGAHNMALLDKQFVRMPLVSEQNFLYPGKNYVRSQYGGNLIFRYVRKKRIRGSVFVKDAVEAPYFELGVTRRGEWNSLKHRDAPHTVLVSRKCVIIGYTRLAQRLRDAESFLEKYDRNINLANDLSGFTRSDPPPPGRHWFINGLMFEFPFVAGAFPVALDRRFFNLVDEKSPGNTILFVFIGFIYYQRIWEPLFGKRALANMYLWYLIEKIYKRDPFGKKLITKVHRELKEGKTYQQFNGVERTVFFLDLIKAAPARNWEMYRHFFRRGRRLKDHEARRLKKEPNYRTEFVYYEISIGARKDLFPIFHRWGFKITPRKRNKVKAKLRGGFSTASRIHSFAPFQTFCFLYFVYVFNTKE